MVKGGKYRGILTLNPQSSEGRLEIGWAFRGFLPSGSEVWAEVRCGVQKEVGAELGKGGGAGKVQSHPRSRGRRNTPRMNISFMFFPVPSLLTTFPPWSAIDWLLVKTRMTKYRKEEKEVLGRLKSSFGFSYNVVWKNPNKLLANPADPQVVLLRKRVRDKQILASVVYPLTLLDLISAISGTPRNFTTTILSVSTQRRIQQEQSDR